MAEGVIPTTYDARVASRVKREDTEPFTLSAATYDFGVLGKPGFDGPDFAYLRNKGASKEDLLAFAKTASTVGPAVARRLGYEATPSQMIEGIDPALYKREIKPLFEPPDEESKQQIKSERAKRRAKRKAKMRLAYSRPERDQDFVASGARLSEGATAPASPVV